MTRDIISPVKNSVEGMPEAIGQIEREKVGQGGQLSLPDGRQVTWSATIEQAGVADLFRLTLQVESLASGNLPMWKHEESLHMLRPAWSDPAERDRLRAQTKQRVDREQGL